MTHRRITIAIILALICCTLSWGQSALHLTLKSVFIEGGTFRMGMPSGEDFNARIVHSVTLDSFRMTTTEVTVGDFRRFVDATGYRTSAERAGGGRVSIYQSNNTYYAHHDATWRKPYYIQSDDHPVVMVSWYDAVEYANWLSKQDGLTLAYEINGTDVTWSQSANGWRLPTEAEWEYAARGGRNGRQTKYAGTNISRELPLYANYAHGGSHLAGDGAALDYGHGGAAPVGSYRENELGLYDMSGNVREWCWDLFWRYSAGSQTNPTGPTDPIPSDARVTRGGSWAQGPFTTQVAHRYNGQPDDGKHFRGFRLVVSADK